MLSNSICPRCLLEKINTLCSCQLSYPLEECSSPNPESENPPLIQEGLASLNRNPPPHNCPQSNIALTKSRAPSPVQAFVPPPPQPDPPATPLQSRVLNSSPLGNSIGNPIVITSDEEEKYTVTPTGNVVHNITFRIELPAERLIRLGFVEVRNRLLQRIEEAVEPRAPPRRNLQRDAYQAATPRGRIASRGFEP